MYAFKSDPAIVRRWNRSESLFWRWRWPTMAMAALVLVGLGYAHALNGSAPASITVAGAYETVSVGDGETLWGIASSRYPNADPRLKVAQIEQLNGLGGPMIEAGQRLKVPAR
jgi:hypothetical protein